MEQPEILLATQSIDDILRRIGFGKFQIINFLLIGWFWLADGAELVVISLITRLLQKVWDLTDFEVEIMAGILYIGMICGTFIGGSVGDRFGRRKPLIFLSGLLVITGLLSAAMPEFYSFVIMRAFVGMCMGASTPIATASLLEANTPKSRAMIVVAAEMQFVLGCIFIIGVAMGLMPDFQPEYWRELLVIASIPACIALLFQCIYLDESPRFLAVKQRYEECVEIMNKIARMNNSHCLNESEIDIIAETAPPKVTNYKERLRRLFSPMYRSITIKLFIAWWVVGFIYYGVVFIMPRTLESDENESEVLPQLLIMNTSMIPSVILPCILVETKWFGRRNTIRLCFLGQVIFAIICILVVDDNSIFVLSSTALFFVNNVMFDVIFPYTAEIYDTTIRSTSFSLCTVWARFAGFISPFVLLSLHEQDKQYPYVAFAIIATIGAIVGMLLKYEPQGQNLDSLDVENEEKISIN